MTWSHILVTLPPATANTLALHQRGKLPNSPCCCNPKVNCFTSYTLLKQKRWYVKTIKTTEKRFNIEALKYLIYGHFIKNLLGFQKVCFRAEIRFYFKAKLYTSNSLWQFVWEIKDFHISSIKNRMKQPQSLWVHTTLFFNIRYDKASHPPQY